MQLHTAKPHQKFARTIITIYVCVAIVRVTPALHRQVTNSNSVRGILPGFGREYARVIRTCTIGRTVVRTPEKKAR